MFRILFAPSAIEDLKALRRADQQRVRSETRAQLVHEPLIPTRNRKRLRPNRLATWELRVGDLRIFYDVDDGLGTVLVTAIGVEVGSRLTIRGQEYKL